MTEQQIDAFRLADNKVSEIAAWNFDKLEMELESITDIDMSEFNFNLDGGNTFDESQLDELFADAPEKEKKPKMIKCPHCGQEFEA